MKTIPLEGLDGREPLGLFAALGLLSVLSVPYPHVELGWTGDESGKTFALIRSDESRLNSARVAGILADLLKLLSAKDPDIITDGRDTIDYSVEELRAQLERAVETWIENAHEQSGTRADLIRTTIAPGMLTALGSDALSDNHRPVQRTPLSLSNGQSRKCLLKDFRSLASLTTPQKLEETLHGTATPCRATSLNWHPSDNRPKAYRGTDPEMEKPLCDPGINALAFLGLAFFPVIPTPTFAVAGVSVQNGNTSFSWPLWQTPLTRDRVNSLLAHATRYTRTPSIGLLEIRCSQMINTGRAGRLKFFLPSRRVR